MTAAPDTTTDPSLAAQVGWLVDRAQLSDLLVRFAHALDTRDWAGYGQCYTEDGVLSVAGAFQLDGRAAIVAGTEKTLGGYVGTWHLSANHAIEVSGDTARTRSYLHGVHRLDDDRARHADGGGWYDNTAVRTPEGWRFTSVTISEVWTNGDGLPSDR